MKILILTCSFSDTIGGIENFNRILIENFGNSYIFYELGLYENVCFSIKNNAFVTSKKTNSQKYVWLGNKNDIIDLNKFTPNRFENISIKKNTNFIKFIKNIVNFFYKFFCFFKLGKTFNFFYYKFCSLLNYFNKIKKNTKLLKNFIKENKIDLLICLPDSNKLFNVKLAKIKEVKKIAVVHSDINSVNNRKKVVFDKKEQIIKYVNRNLFFLLKKYKLNYFDKIIVSNPYELSFLKKNLFIRNKCEFINFSIFEKELILKNMGSLKENRIIFVGRLSQGDKNLIELNKIANLLNHQKIYVYGDGKDKCKLTSDNIIMQGLINKKDLYEVYKKSKILILTSSTEGIPFVISEALSFGLIVVCYDTFKSCHWTLSENRGYIIKPYCSQNFVDTIKKILNMTKIDFDTQSTKNIKFASENFSLETTIKKWDFLFKKEKYS